MSRWTYNILGYAYLGRPGGQIRKRICVDLTAVRRLEEEETALDRTWTGQDKGQDHVQ